MNIRNVPQNEFWDIREAYLKMGYDLSLHILYNSVFTNHLLYLMKSCLTY
jgi:hypothetical protein